MKARTALPWIAIVVVLVGVALVAGAPTQRNDRPLDPAANGPRGAKAVVVLLDELGADVDVVRGAPPADADVALVLRDRYEDDERDEVRRWVGDGGVLVVADPGSPLHGAGLPTGACPAGIEGVEVVGASFEIARGEGSDGGCFDGFVATATAGAGTIISVGLPTVFANEHLGEVDNAVLAAGLLAPTGTERVAFLREPAGAGDEALLDLLGPRVAQALGQLAVAFGIYVLWRARRLGRPVVEPQPVAVAGSELVTAVGRMLGGRKQPAEAAARVRADLRRALERRLGLPADAPATHVADAVAARSGLDPATVVAALGGRTVTTDADLVEVIADLDHIRHNVLGGRS